MQHSRNRGEPRRLDGPRLPQSKRPRLRDRSLLLSGSELQLGPRSLSLKRPPCPLGRPDGRPYAKSIYQSGPVMAPKQNKRRG